MALVILSNKFYLNHRRLLFVGVITIHQPIPIDNPTLKRSKHFSKLVFVLKVHQAPVLRVFFVVNTYSSNVSRPKTNAEAIVKSQTGFCAQGTVCYIWFVFMPFAMTGSFLRPDFSSLVVVSHVLLLLPTGSLILFLFHLTSRDLLGYFGTSVELC